MTRTARTRWRCAPRLLATIACCALAASWADGEESIGRFPATRRATPTAGASATAATTPATANSPRVATRQPPLAPSSPAPVTNAPLLIEEGNARYGWPNETPSAAENFAIAPPTCACPDCGANGDCRCGSIFDRCVLTHFADWDFAGEHFTHDNPDDPARNVGKGEPLFGTSWRNRPIYTGVLIGGVITAGPLHPWAEHENSPLLSIYQGFDFDHYWGGEMRFAFGRWGLANDGPESENDIYYVDAHLSYYPWGDARWRPYLSGGIGFMGNDFIDSRGLAFNEMLLTIPLTAGIKYQMQPNYAFRLDFTQNISLGSGSLETMDNVSLSAGIEWHYGGAPKSYFPWNAGVYTK